MSNNICYPYKGDTCSPISNLIRDKNKEYFDKINYEISKVVGNLAETSEKYIRTCICEIENYARKGLREKVVETINRVTGFFNFVYKEAYYEVIKRLSNYISRKIISKNDILLLILEKMMSWISSIVERIRKALEPYHVVLGIKDFSLSINVTAPFVQVSFGLTITFSL